MNALTAQFGADKFVMHLHDTRGLALANTLAAMQLGVHKFETAAGGLGGCPFAPGAAGNVATEDTLNMMHEMGIETGIDNDALHEAGAAAPTVCPRPYRQPSDVPVQRRALRLMGSPHRMGTSGVSLAADAGPSPDLGAF